MEYLATAILVVIYRVAIIVSGVVFAWIGYRLFSQGVFHHEGELEIVWNQNRLLLKRAAPGIFFALFGSAVILGSVLWPPTFDYSGVSRGGRAVNASVESNNDDGIAAAADRAELRSILGIIRRLRDGEEVEFMDKARLNSWMEEQRTRFRITAEESSDDTTDATS